MSTSHENIGSVTTDNIQFSIIERLRSATDVVITTHINPDGDALGSALGLYHWLVQLKKRANILLPNAAPANLTWMPGMSEVRIWDESSRSMLESADTIVVLDLNAISRLGDLGAAIQQTQSSIINIDHHTHPEDFAAIQWIDTESCSTCYMIARMIIDSNDGVPVNPDTAMCLYTGIMTDTGSYRFPRTTAAVFHVVSHLVECGADPVRAYDEVMNQGTVGRAQLLGKTLSEMSVLAGNQLCMMSVTQQDLHRFGCTTEDTEGFVQQTLTLRGVTMGILLIELPGETKISFRSKGKAYVRELAAAYGGGGHIYAAGARVRDTPMDDVMQDVRHRALTYLESII